MFDNIFNQETDAFGLEISDLMVALVAVFLMGSVMMSSTIRHLTNDTSLNTEHIDAIIQNKIGAIASKYNIDLLSNGIIRYSEKFADSKSNITDKMKVTLDSLCPELKEIITQKRKLIKSITFEGHTSKKWKGKTSATPYYGNKALSYERATETMKYCLGESFEFNHPELMKKFHAFGYSYSQPIKRKDGSTDWNASKRVDIVIRPFEIQDEYKR